MKSFLSSLTLLGFTVLLLTGCGNSRHVVNYAPSSIMTVKGSSTVGDFRYIPAEQNIVQHNQIKNTAIGSILFEKNITQIIKEAVFSESRLVGINVQESNNNLTGEINLFLADDLGYSIDWTLDIKYVLTKKDNGSICFEGVKVFKKNTPKFVNAFGSMNEVIKSNIEELYRDPQFLKCIKE